MADAATPFKFVPGFDFLEGLVKNASAALPGIGHWVAPTLDPDELDKRIEELRTVKFWLEQNARMLGTTIQALEVQRMTLSTLRTMNVRMDDLRESLKVRMPTAPAEAPAPVARPQRQPEPEPEPEPPQAEATQQGEAPAAAEGAAAPAGAVDPMQWWGALTQQFTQLAANAMKETAAETAKRFTGTLAKPPSPTEKASPAPAKKRTAAKPAAGKTAASGRRAGSKS